MKKLAFLASFGLMTVIATGLAAATPAPTKPVAASFFTGRWYEIARTPNDQQKDCEAPTYQFAPKTAATLSFVLTCHKGAPNGNPASVNVTLHLPPTDEVRNKFRVTAFGGIMGVDYWVLDRADDGDWWILATPTKTPRVWLLSRKADIPASEKTDAMARIKAMGFDPAKLEYPKQA